MQATFVHGNPRFRDYTPASDVSIGDVIVIGNRPYVAHHDIPANTKGALAYEGGVYDLIKDDDSGPNILATDEVYWDGANDLATNVAEDAVHFGPANAAAGASTTPVRVAHQPSGAAIVDES